MSHSCVGAACLAAALVAPAAWSFPIALPGSEGLSVRVTSTDDVIATYQGNSASYFNDLLLDGRFVFNNQATPVGTVVNLGSFAVGTELVFELYVHNTGDHFYTGPASRNADGHAHARVQADWTPGSSLVSFEDLFRGPYDYNDLSFSFTNTTSSVPEPGAAGLAMAGLAALLAAGRRRRRSLSVSARPA